jgi:hypothetical protein
MFPKLWNSYQTTTKMCTEREIKGSRLYIYKLIIGRISTKKNSGCDTEVSLQKVTSTLEGKLRCSTLNGMKERKRETSCTANKQKDTLLSDGWEDQASSSQYFSFLLLPFPCICQPPFNPECTNVSLLWLIWYRDGRQTSVKVLC